MIYLLHEIFKWIGSMFKCLNVLMFSTFLGAQGWWGQAGADMSRFHFFIQSIYSLVQVFYSVNLKFGTGFLLIQFIVCEFLGTCFFIQSIYSLQICKYMILFSQFIVCKFAKTGFLLLQFIVCKFLGTHVFYSVNL